jgi:hypothetical protein
MRALSGGGPGSGPVAFAVSSGGTRPGVAGHSRRALLRERRETLGVSRGRCPGNARRGRAGNSRVAPVRDQTREGAGDQVRMLRDGPHDGPRGGGIESVPAVDRPGGLGMRVLVSAHAAPVRVAPRMEAERALLVLAAPSPAAASPRIMALCAMRDWLTSAAPGLPRLSPSASCPRPPEGRQRRTVISVRHAAGKPSPGPRAPWPVARAVRQPFRGEAGHQLRSMRVAA